MDRRQKCARLQAGSIPAGRIESSPAANTSERRQATMFESEQQLRELQALIDRTLARANPHLAKIVKLERRLTARQVVRYLQGTKHVAFATVNERGEPRVAPLDGVFIQGRFTVSTGGRAARLRHLRANPACSATHMDGDAIGIVVHGHATIIGRADARRRGDRAGLARDLRLEPVRMGRGRRLHAHRADLDVGLRLPSGELPRVARHPPGAFEARASSAVSPRGSPARADRSAPRGSPRCGRVSVL
jgi:Pyridoxamine 5'-phosphate oxidase